MRIKKIFTVIIVLLFCKDISAQSLTGTWKGRIVDDGEYLEINIVQVGNTLCGYTGDYVLTDPESFCKAYFTGTYIKDKKQYFLNGTNFIENSGSHVLMQILFSVSKKNGKPVMNGWCRTKPEFPFSDNSPSVISLTKVSPKPTVMTETMKNCVKDNTPKKMPARPTPTRPQNRIAPRPKPIISKPVIAKPVIKNKDSAVSHIVTNPKDTAKVGARQPVITIPDAKPLPLKTAGRPNKEIQTIIIHQKKLTLNIYDNAEVDGDSISIFYNGRLLMSHMRLTEKPIKVDLTLDENTTLHSFVIFAENLGTIPPNTALIIFTDSDGKRYELFSKADLGVNAELVFKYVP